MIDKLKPCPFCGKKAVSSEYADRAVFWVKIKCKHCGATIKNGSAKGKCRADKAIAAWNRRATEAER